MPPGSRKRRRRRKADAVREREIFTGGGFMNRLWEIMRWIMLREAPLETFEKEVMKGGAFVFEVFLRKGADYTIRGKISKGSGSARMSLGDSLGLTLPVGADGGGTRFSVIPEEDGIYKIWSTVQPNAGIGKPVVFTITLSNFLPLPEYVRGQSVPPLRPSGRPGSKDTDAAEQEERVQGEAG
jgi:hypothetical protein